MSENHFSPDQMKSHYIERMGEELGAIFSELWQEVAFLYHKWQYFELLMDEKHQDLFFDTFSQFFHTTEWVYLENILLHICRITDVKETGRDKKPNLTIRRFPDLISDEERRKAVAKAVDNAVEVSEDIKLFRDKFIAHIDYFARFPDKALKPEEAIIPRLPVLKIKEAIGCIVDVMNTVDEGRLAFDSPSSVDGRDALIQVLSDGIELRKIRQEKMRRGDYS